MRALLLVCLVIAGACGPDVPWRASAPQPGMSAPQKWHAVPGRVVLAWVIPQNDLLSCSTAAHDVRRVRARYGMALDVRVIAVGEQHELIASFLRSERLGDLPVDHLSEVLFASAYGFAATSSIFLVRGDTVVDHVPVNRDSLLVGGGTGRLETSVRRQMSGLTVPEAPHTSP